LELTDKKSYGRVLGRPSILVKDNEEGVIKAEYIKYVAEYSSDTVTPDQGSAQISQNVTFKDYPTGITLTITPHIASEKLMQLEIELDRKDLDPADSSGGVVSVKGEEYPKPLDTVSSNIKTWSIVPSGATIILGGIEGSNQIKGVDKVPILGDIPLVGLLFRGISQTDNQTKLYIFVKANIIQSGDELTGKSDIERISQKKRQAFEEDEANFQKMQALPGPKPNPMIPEKILEDDEYIQKLKEQQQQGNVITVPLN
jgi:type II secretory pathway component GspD/PulD (secretin)